MDNIGLRNFGFLVILLLSWIIHESRPPHPCIKMMDKEAACEEG